MEPIIYQFAWNFYSFLQTFWNDHREKCPYRENDVDPVADAVSQNAGGDGLQQFSCIVIPEPETGTDRTGLIGDTKTPEGK